MDVREAGPAGRAGPAVEFRQALRERRQGRGLSQLDLALRSGTTQRHVSFLESGRSVPGRAMVVRLAESLGLPLRDRNALLLTAGYAPAYPETPLTDPDLAPVRSALRTVLAGHRPYPAVVVDRLGDLVAANDAADLLTEGAAPELLEPPANAYRLALHPGGLAPRVLNLARWGRHVTGALRRSATDGDERVARLAAELEGYLPPAEGVDGPEAGDGGAGEAGLGFAVPLRLRAPGGAVLSLITTVTTFATATDVTLAELKLEAFLPADGATAEALAARHRARPPAPDA